MDALERQIAADLDVDPSPGFVARVRARVADEPPPVRWRLSMRAAGAVAAAVVLVVVATWKPASDVHLPAPPASVSAPAVVRALTPVTAAGSRVHARPAPAVASDETKALREMQAMLRLGDVVVAFEDDDGAITIAPIELAPVDVASNIDVEAQGEGQ